MDEKILDRVYDAVVVSISKGGIPTQGEVAERLGIPQDLADEAFEELISEGLLGAIEDEPEEDEPKAKPKAKKAKPKAKSNKLEDKILRIIKAGIKNLLLVGPTGCGKTECSKALGKILKREVVIISCDIGTPPSAFKGRTNPMDAKDYQEVPFVKGYREGAIIIVDEMDALDPGVATGLNAALANGHIPTPGGPVERHEDTIIIATANTWGQGGNRLYVSSNPLSAATLTRFDGGRIAVDYCRVYEASVGDAEVCEFVWAVREHIAARRLERVACTRMIIACTKLKAAGLDDAEWKAQVTLGWEESERQGIAA